MSCKAGNEGDSSDDLDWTGTGLTRLGGGSSRFQPRSIHSRRKSVLPEEFKRGSGDPTLRNVWATNRR